MEQANQGENTLGSEESSLQKKLEKQGVNFTVPERFLVSPNPDFKTDEKTGLIIETNGVRRHLVERLSESIKTGKKWALANADCDNLKTANTRYNRPFGDLVIKYGASAITQLVNNSNISSNVEILAVRDGQTADEFSVWFFGISDEEIKKLHDNATNLIAIKTKDPDFTFSISLAILGYNNPRIQERLRETERFLKSDDSRLAYNFYQHSVKELAEADANQIKIEKDLDRLRELPETHMLTSVSMQKFIDSIIETFGNSRVSDKLLEVLLKLTSAQAAIALSENVESQQSYIKLLEEIGVTGSRISNAKSPEDLLNIFRDIFGSQ